MDIKNIINKIDNKIQNFKKPKNHKELSPTMQKILAFNPPKYIQNLLMVLTVILALITAYGIMCLTVYINNTINRKKYGVQSPKASIECLIDAIENKSKSNIKKCFNPNDKNKDKKIKLLYNFAKENNKNKIDIETLDDEDNNNNLDKIKKETGIKDIDKTIITNVYINNELNDDNTKYEIYNIYNITTYKTNDKWYIQDVTANDYIIKKTKDYKLTNNSLVKIGNDDMGYINTPTSWVSRNADKNISENANNCICVGDNNNTLTMATYDTDKDIDTVSNILYENFKNTDYKYKKMDDYTLNGISSKKITAYSKKEKTYKYIWIFKQSLRNNYIHCIELNTKKQNESYKYIETYQ